MPEEKVIENSLNEAHDAGLGRYILVLLIIFAVLWAINTYYSSQNHALPVPKAEESPSQEAATSTDNQAAQAQAERTSDVFTYNSAIERRDKKLCERIIDESLKSDCLKFFTVNGL